MSRKMAELMEPGLTDPHWRRHHCRCSYGSGFDNLQKVCHNLVADLGVYKFSASHFLSLFGNRNTNRNTTDDIFTQSSTTLEDYGHHQTEVRRHVERRGTN